MTAEPTPPILSARSLSRTYGTGPACVEALKGVDLDVLPGTFTSIMGPSGSGKSTLVHCLSGMDRPTSGSVTLEGVQMVGMKDRALTELRRRRIGFVFQSFNLLPTHTVTHVADAAAAGDRVVVIRDGRVVEDREARS